MTKYVIYARVSTLNDSQASSYETQESELEARVRVIYPSYELVRVYGDLGISGSREDRPEFQQMLADAKEGLFEVIVTKSISRFARNVRLLLNALKELEEYGVAVLFLEENIDTRSPSQKFLLTVLGALAEMERENTREHIKESYATKHAAGKMAKPHTTSYGYRRENGKTVIDPEQAEVIKKIFSWFVEDGLSYGAIVQRLIDENVPVPRPKDGHTWHRPSVRYILMNSKYCGRPQEHTESGEVLTFEGLPIIDVATYEAAQRLIEEYSRRPKVQKLKECVSNFKPQKYPLSGLCKCLECGGKVTRYTRVSTLRSGEYPLDLCDYAIDGTPLWGCLKLSGAKIHGVKCNTYLISEQYLYDMIIEAITFACTHYDSNRMPFTGDSFNLFSKLILDRQNIEKYNNDELTYQTRRKDLENQIERERDLYAKGLSSLDRTESRIKALNKNINSLIKPQLPEEVGINMQHLRRIKDVFSGGGTSDDFRSSLKALCLDSEFRRSLVRALVSEIIIGGEPRFQATITLRYYNMSITLRTAQRSPRRRSTHINYDKVEVIDCQYS